MTPLFHAAWEIHQFLARHKIPYAIIGGFAVQRWGAPRLTVDVDLTTLAPSDRSASDLVALFLTQFHARTADPVGMAREHRVILLATSTGTGIDVSLGVPLYEDEMLHRAVDYTLEPGKTVRVCSAEDLIIHKSVAGRPQDLRDIESVIARQGRKLDVAYVRKWLNAFAETVPDPEIAERFERVWKAWRRATPRSRGRVARKKRKDGK